jgi:hypothetical protein
MFFYLWKFGGNSGLIIGASGYGVKQKIHSGIYYLTDSPPLAGSSAPSVTSWGSELLIAGCENSVI